jgi:hypothetical protein
MSGGELRLSVTDHWDGEGLKEAVLHDDDARADMAALAALQSLGCVRLAERGAETDFGQNIELGDDATVWIEYPLRITALGELVIRAIEEMRPGLECRP